VPLYSSPGHVSDVPTCGFVIAQFENNVDNTAHCVASCLVYQALTAIRKDCGRIGKKASAQLPAPKSRHSFELAVVIAPARSGNGEQPWL
jgi:hypothetical protein